MTAIELAKQNGKQPIQTTQREDFGGSQSTALAETASTAVAAQARAAVESRFIMALRRPRDIMETRSKLLRECDRPGFADAAIYHKPIGKGIEGPSIRFAEAAMRCMTNLLIETPTVYDDLTKRIVRVSVTDLESNVAYGKDIVVDKTVERREVKDRTVISVRENSTGQKSYTVTATEDELLNKEGALVSKAMRTLALRHLPGDILDECMAKCQAVLRDRASKDPGAEIKKLADAFGSVNVSPADLAGYLGHPIDKCVPAEIVDLRKVYATLKDGETTWAAILDAKGDESKPEAPPAPPTKVADLVTGEKTADPGPAKEAAKYLADAATATQGPVVPTTVTIWRTELAEVKSIGPGLLKFAARLRDFPEPWRTECEKEYQRKKEAIRAPVEQREPGEEG